ncbi:MAG: metal-dependent hydrolase [Rhodothermaceae bacterium]|nr:MAG: metal-dependent hydrolase [Rhodothermaceae bacterium]
MATYRGHIAGASVFYGLYLGLLAFVFMVDAAYARFSTLELVAYPLALFGLCLMFGLWPDVDTNSVGQNLFYTIFFLADVVLIATKHFEEAAYLGLFAILPVLGKHRGWTHTWWAMLLIPSPLLLLPYLFFPERPLSGLPFYGAAVVGYFSHLFMDGLIIPFKRRRRVAR